VGLEEGLEMVGASIILFGALSIVAAVASEALVAESSAAADSDAA
jgi:hypothetical protein